MKTEQILSLLRVGAWIVYIGAIIRTVMLAVGYGQACISGEIDFHFASGWPSLGIFRYC